MSVYDILKYKRSIEIWDALWYEETSKLRRKILKFDRSNSDPIVLQISGYSDAKSETMVLFDLLGMVQAPIHTVGAGGIEGLNGLLFMAGNVRVAYPNMWIKPWWPRRPIDLDNSDLFPNQYETSLNRLDEHIVNLYSRALRMSVDEYKDMCMADDAFLATDLLDLELIDTILHKDSNWLVDLIGEMNNDV